VEVHQNLRKNCATIRIRCPTRAMRPPPPEVGVDPNVLQVRFEIVF
jgi:hypothetical protein